MIESKAIPKLLKFFAFAHLPEHLRVVSEPFSVIANRLAEDLPWSLELESCLRKLLEAKDSAVELGWSHDDLQPF